MTENVILAVSLSLDAFVISITYRLRGIVVGWMARFIIGLVGMFTTGMAITVGSTISRYITVEQVKYLGAAIILFMGIRILMGEITEEKAISYDKDDSRRIDAKEALLVGFALSGDSISAGVAVAMMGERMVTLPIIIGITNILFLWLGQFVKIKGRYCQVCSGVLMILLGIMRIFF